MSHTSTISSIRITSLSALSSAVRELAQSGLKCELMENATPRAFYPNQAGLGVADLVLVLGDARYDVGLYKQADGSYEARTDFWQGSVEGVLGVKPSSEEKKDQAKLGKLFQMYAVHATLEQARRKGLNARRMTGADGKIKVVLTGASL